MRRKARFVILIATIASAIAMWPDLAQAQRRRSVPTPRPRPAPAERVRPVGGSGVVFIGGYFYDPFFGPYPWWSRAAYPYPYYPLYDESATLRVLVTPTNAAVYVDGFYAGIVDDFNGFFQGLPLPPGGHEMVLYLEGYRTVHQRVYLAPASTFKLRDTLQPLRVGEASEPPTGRNQSGTPVRSCRRWS